MSTVVGLAPRAASGFASGAVFSPGWWPSVLAHVLLAVTVVFGIDLMSDSSGGRVGLRSRLRDLS